FNNSSTYYGASCRASNLGNPFSVSMTLTRRVGANKFSLNVPGAFDTINSVSGKMMPLEDGILYRATVDIFGCTNKVLPPDTTCSPQNNKLIYLQFSVADSGAVTLEYLNGYFQYRLYSGDANSLSEAQNAHSYPARISDLKSVSDCMTDNYYCGYVYNNVCV